jgi:ABC-type nitrate/sulfonate/bicarbonate transport system substrate-binding protein
MRTIRLAYRDHDRTPVIYCLKAMAARYYGINVEVVHIEPQAEFEAALFNGSADAIIEHFEYLHAEASHGKKVTFFCAPQIHRGLKLVVPRNFHSLDDLKNKTMAVRDLGRPYTITLWLRKMGLEASVRTAIFKDRDIGRWKQWRKVLSGECAACFVSPLYLPDALAAGLTVFPTEEAEIVSNFAQACLSSFAASNPALMKDYLKAVTHALGLLIYRREAALEIAAGEPMRSMKITDPAELRRQVDSMAEKLRVKPYPTVDAILHTNEIAAQEYGAAVDNPLMLWDLHWLKELDDEGFIDSLISDLSAMPA